jgi:hypothetical protein
MTPYVRLSVCTERRANNCAPNAPALPGPTHRTNARVACNRSTQSDAGRSIERARHRVARGLPLRDAGARATRLEIPVSCRLSFYFYNSIDGVDRAVDAVEAVVSGNRVLEKVWSWLHSRPTARPRRPIAAV